MTNAQSTSKITTVIFDFDGTIADSFAVLLDAAYQLLPHTGKLSDEQIELLRDSTVKDIIKQLNIKKLQIPKLLIDGRRLVSKNMSTVMIFDGMQDVIKSLADNGTNIYILSSNGKIAIDSFLRRNDLKDSIRAVYAGTSIWGKTRQLKKLLATEGVQAERCIYVGDEVRDIESAHKASMRIISVGWGFNTKHALTAAKPDFLVDTPQALANTITNL